MVLFPFPFWEFLSLCEGARLLHPNRVLCVYVSVCAQETIERERERNSLLKCEMQKCLRGVIPLCVFVSEDSLNYNCMATQSRNARQAWAKPCWTRLNQTWTYAAQHALRFKPWLIGPKASQSPFPAVTGTGLRKERDGERGKEHGREMFLKCFDSFTCIPTGSIQLWVDFFFFTFLRFCPFLMLSWLGGFCIWSLKKCLETSDNKAIWPSK